MCPVQTEKEGVSWAGRHLSGIVRHGRSTIVLYVGPSVFDERRWKTNRFGRDEEEKAII
jgi:hypothetical protein